jgi:hypothetical protein
MRKALIVLSLAGALFGCGGGTDYTCCINGLYYQCSADDTQVRCGNADTTACPRDATKDNTCR